MKIIYKGYEICLFDGYYRLKEDYIPLMELIPKLEEQNNRFIEDIKLVVNDKS